MRIKMQSISVFLDTTKVPDFGWKMKNWAQGVCHVIYIFFLDLFR